MTKQHCCPVCRNGMVKCNHLFDRRAATFDDLKRHGSTPLDLGIARFAADVFELLNSHT